MTIHELAKASPNPEQAPPADASAPLTIANEPSINGGGTDKLPNL
jgi:hypothetical protein